MKFVSAAQSCAGFLLLMLVAGCTTYYRITDQPTRRTYYTTDYDRTDSGGVRFYDDKSRAWVTLQSTEIVEISKDGYQTGIRE
jgi:hypothetical protein